MTGTDACHYNFGIQKGRFTRMDTPFKYVFLDTDIGPDCDDAAALAILMDQCARIGAEVRCITHCTGSPYGLPAIDAICRKFGTIVSLGTSERRDFLSDRASLKYTPVIAERNAYRSQVLDDQPDALGMFWYNLSRVPENSALLISIGPLNNLARYISDIPCRRLMTSRITRIVSMAGCFEGEPGHVEWNVEMDVPAARTVIEKWPGRLDFCPSEVFDDVLTGSCLAAYPDNPVSIAYRLYTEGRMLRPSWDPGTVLAALYDKVDACAWSHLGRISVDDNGITRFKKDGYGQHRYLRRIGPCEDTARQIESALSSAMETMEKPGTAKV